MSAGGRSAARAVIRWQTSWQVLLVAVLALSSAAHNVSHAAQLSSESCAICSTVSCAAPSQAAAPPSPHVAPSAPPWDAAPPLVSRIASASCAPRGPPVL